MQSSNNTFKIILLVIVVFIAGYLVSSSMNKPDTGQTGAVANAVTNGTKASTIVNGGACTDNLATNFGGTLPCKYPVEGTFLGTSNGDGGCYFWFLNTDSQGNQYITYQFFNAPCPPSATIANNRSLSKFQSINGIPSTGNMDINTRTLIDKMLKTPPAK